MFLSQLLKKLDLKVTGRMQTYTMRLAIALGPESVGVTESCPSLNITCATASCQSPSR